MILDGEERNTTYSIEDIPAKYIKEIKKYSSMAYYERNAYKLSAALGVRIRPGIRTSVIPGPPETIILEPRLLGSLDNDAIRHELAHVLMWRTNIEQMLIEEFGYVELATPMIEALCRAGVLFLKAPQPVVDRAIRLYGVSARAVKYVHMKGRVTPQEALQRVIYDDPSAARAGMIMSGSYVSDIAQCNFNLPFWLAHRIPEVSHLKIPEGSQVSFCRGSHARQTIGVFTT